MLSFFSSCCCGCSDPWILIIISHRAFSICKILTRNDLSKALPLNECYSLTVSFSLTIGLVCFIFPLYIFLILDSCFHDLTLWPELKYSPLVPVSSTLCTAERTRYSWSQRSPTVGVEESRIGDNPCHGRQIAAISMLDVPDPSYQTISEVREK